MDLLRFITESCASLPQKCFSLLKTFPLKYSRRNINLRQARAFYSRRIDNVYHSEDSLASLRPRTWELVPLEMNSN